MLLNSLACVKIIVSSHAYIYVHIYIYMPQYNFVWSCLNAQYLPWSLINNLLAFHCPIYVAFISCTSKMTVLTHHIFWIISSLLIIIPLSKVVLSVCPPWYLFFSFISPISLLSFYFLCFYSFLLSVWV